MASGSVEAGTTKQCVVGQYDNLFYFDVIESTMMFVWLLEWDTTYLNN
jgi:hypothetical protein